MVENTSMTEKKRFIGLMLCGSRSHNTTIAVLDYFHGKGRLFLVESLSGFKGNIHPDLDIELADRIKSLTSETDSTIITNAPLSLPPCYKCLNEKCLGKLECTNPETVYIINAYNKLKKGKKNLREFSPYTQRAQDIWLREAISDVTPPHETMGSNMAQLSSRMLHLKKLLFDCDFKEAYVRACLSRILKALKLPDYFIERYKDFEAGQRTRKKILKVLEDDGIVFIYDSDFESITTILGLFEAFVLSLTGVIHYLNNCVESTELINLGLNTILLPKKDIKL